MKIKFIIFIAFLCLAKFGFSNTDSLATFINSSKDLNKKFIAINDMLEVELKRSPKKALPFTLLQLKIAKVDTQIARANLNVGLAYDIEPKFNSSIDANYRNKNIGTALINKAKARCKEQHYKGIIIQTENTNPAQDLYQREGFVKDTDLTFFWTNK